MTIALHGIGISKGIAIGKVHIIKHHQLDICKYNIEPRRIDHEIKRFENALIDARQQLREIRQHIPNTINVDIVAFIDTHLLMLEDTSLTKEPVRLIKALSCNAEWALKLQRDALVEVFDKMEDAYLRTRKNDVDYVVNRIQNILLKHTPLAHEKTDHDLQNYIVLANDLAPSDTVLMQQHGIAAFATELGGPTSHTAILARSLGIPAIVSLKNMLSYIKNDDLLIIDGNNGVLLIDASKQELAEYRRSQKKQAVYITQLRKLKDKECITLDGTKIGLHANIELPKDFETVVEVGAHGVGLYRTEFLYMNRQTPPDEAEHFNTYTSVLNILNGLPLTIRTLDLGADKQVDGGRKNESVTSNPALGLRAIRLCLKEPSLFYPQLRAIIRASAHGNIRMMIPMLSNTHEIQQILQIVQGIKQEFDQAGIPYDPDLQIGGMIEVPAAAICAEIFAKRLDFLSIGTNDLIQYTMAIDRVNDEVNYLYDPLNPAVLNMLYNTLRAGQKQNISVAICGEMASEIKYTRLLLALGLREFSLHPTMLLEVKQIIMESDIRHLKQLTKKALKASNGIEVANMCYALEKKLKTGHAQLS